MDAIMFRKSSYSHTTAAVHCVEIGTVALARKSSYSPHGQPECVEVAQSTARKSSHSGIGGGGECVEIAEGRETARQVVVVQDTKQAGRRVRDQLAFGTDAWGRFTRGLKG